MKRKTNTQFIVDLMEYSRCGALSQIFILDALKKHAEKVAAVPLNELQLMFEGHFISAEGWHAVAVEIAEAFERRDGGAA